MNRALIWLAAIVTLIPGTLVGANPGGVQYLSPLPGSRLVSRASTIIVRPGGRLDASVLAGASIRVTGERSGGIETGLVLSTDGRTIIARPDRMFEPGETVTVEVDGAIATTDGQ
ncbi:MAG: Bacterial Ig-like domain, partial [Bacteroidetes bacterium]|nr:Bacterial Ig-like domain [Bacteroidota bacterium]